MKKTAWIGLLVLALVALLAAGAWAWFTASDEATNTFTAGTVKIEINESGFVDVAGWTPGVETAKKVSVKSSGSKATYVRVSLTPVWGQMDGDSFVPDPSLPVSNVQLDWNHGGWVHVALDQQGGGWYYCKSILAGGSETALLLRSVTLDTAGTDDRYQGKALQIVVNAEAVQASHEAYKDAWGLDALPAGVQAWVAP